MLSITIPKSKYFNEDKNEYLYYPEITLKLEHSLISLQRWESKWHKSYLTAASMGMTVEENLDYIRCMCLDQSVGLDTIKRITRSNFNAIVAYINDPMTATTVRDPKGKTRQRIVTAEVLYAIMIENGIPFECAKWHLNQLLMLIRVCGARNIPAKKQSASETAALYSAMNSARRKQTGSRG